MTLETPSYEPTAFRRSLDRLISRTWLWGIPNSVRPNHVTVVRFALTPFVLVALHYGLRWLGLFIFVVAVCTDFMDGAMARTRDQITAVGIVIDPIADKLLIGSVMIYVGYEYLIIKIMLAMILIEMLVIALGVAPWRSSKHIVPANVFGKLKMVLLSVGMFFFLTGKIFLVAVLVTVSVGSLWAGLALAVASGIKQVRSFSAAGRGGGVPSH